jgi:hypothetical protein
MEYPLAEQNALPLATTDTALALRRRYRARKASQ